jgi:hypothetical protein
MMVGVWLNGGFGLRIGMQPLGGYGAMKSRCLEFGHPGLNSNAASRL